MTYFPWPQYSQPWSLNISADLSSDPEVGLDLDETARRIVVEPDSNWTNITLRFEAGTDESIDVDGELTVYVLISASRTNLRLPVSLQQAGNSYVGRVALERAMLGGAVAIVAQIVAAEPVRLIGASEPWTLVVDPGVAPPRQGTPPIAVRWVKFGDADAPLHAQRAADSYAVLDMTGLEPELLLNDEVEGFRSLMMSKKPQLERRRLQTVLGSSVARMTMASLVREAQARIVENDDDTFDPPAEPLYRQVLEALAAQLDSVADVDELCIGLGNPRIMQPADRSRLWIEIDNAIDRMTNHAETVAEVVREVRFV